MFTTVYLLTYRIFHHFKELRKFQESKSSRGMVFLSMSRSFLPPTNHLWNTFEGWAICTKESIRVHQEKEKWETFNQGLSYMIVGVCRTSLESACWPLGKQAGALQQEPKLSRSGGSLGSIPSFKLIQSGPPRLSRNLPVNWLRTSVLSRDYPRVTAGLVFDWIPGPRQIDS